MKHSSTFLFISVLLLIGCSNEKEVVEEVIEEVVKEEVKLFPPTGAKKCKVRTSRDLSTDLYVQRYNRETNVMERVAIRRNLLYTQLLRNGEYYTEGWESFMYWWVPLGQDSTRLSANGEFKEFLHRHDSLDAWDSRYPNDSYKCQKISNSEFESLKQKYIEEAKKDEIT